MSQPPPIQRPPDARPRRNPEDDEPPPGPSEVEAAGIERGQARLFELGGARLTVDDRLAATLLTWPGRGPAFNLATCLRWTADDWADRAAAVTAHFEAAGEAGSLLVSEGVTTPTDLADRLREAGWIDLGEEIVLWTRRAAAVPHLGRDLRLEAVAAGQVDAYEAVERDVFGISEREADDRRGALRAALEAGRLRVYLVRDEGRPVATARLHVADGLAAIHGLGVVPDQRRRGLGAYLTTIVTRAGLALGGSLVWLSVDPANTAAVHLYKGLDYRPAFTWRRFLAVR